MGMTIITSLYRSDHHLTAYSDHAQKFAHEVAAAGIPLQFVIVANDATPLEDQIITTLQLSLDVDSIFVPRETLYASWNRGLDAAKYDVIGFWNVDDRRNADSAIRAYQKLQQGADLVDMPYIAVEQQTGNTTQHQPFQPQFISPRTIMSMFAMFHRDLFLQAGDFNSSFRIAGDFEWCTRDTVRQSNIVTLDDIGGYFIIHDSNLSNGTNPLEWVEVNTVLLWHGYDDYIRPVDPDMMRENWQTWGYTGRAQLPAHIEAWLWGDGAHERYQAYTRERNQPQWIQRIRLALARRGLLSSVVWDVHNR